MLSLNYIFNHLAYQQQNYFYRGKSSHNINSDNWLMMYKVKHSWIHSFIHSFCFVVYSIDLCSRMSTADDIVSIFQKLEQWLKLGSVPMEPQVQQKELNWLLLLFHIENKQCHGRERDQVQWELRSGRGHIFLG